MKPEELEVVRLTEANLLGSLLIAGSNGDTEPIVLVKTLVRVDDFLPNYRDGIHKRIFQAMVAGRTDQISVANTMNDTGTLRAGDLSYMCELVAAAVSALDCEHFARLVADNAERWRSGGRAKPRFTGVI